MCVSPFQKWHKRRRVHDDHNVTSDTAIVVDTSFMCLCGTDESVFIPFLFRLAVGNAADTGHGGCESTPVTVPVCCVFPVPKPFCPAVAGRGNGRQNRSGNKYRRRNTRTRKPCKHDNDGCRTSVMAAGKHSFPPLLLRRPCYFPWRVAPFHPLPFPFRLSMCMPPFPCRLQDGISVSFSLQGQR